MPFVFSSSRTWSKPPEQGSARTRTRVPTATMAPLGTMSRPPVLSTRSDARRDSSTEGGVSAVSSASWSDYAGRLYETS